MGYFKELVELKANLNGQGTSCDGVSAKLVEPFLNGARFQQGDWFLALLGREAPTPRGYGEPSAGCFWIPLKKKRGESFWDQAHFHAHFVCGVQG